MQNVCVECAKDAGKNAYASDAGDRTPVQLPGGSTVLSVPSVMLHTDARGELQAPPSIIPTKCASVAEKRICVSDAVAKIQAHWQGVSSVLPAPREMLAGNESGEMAIPPSFSERERTRRQTMSGANHIISVCLAKLRTHLLCQAVSIAATARKSEKLKGRSAQNALTTQRQPMKQSIIAIRGAIMRGKPQGYACTAGGQPMAWGHRVSAAA